MDTKLFKDGEKFFFVEKESDGLLAFVIFPTIFAETRQRGLSVKTTRITLAFCRFRYHLHFGRRIDPPVLHENFLSASFMNWAQSWAKQPISKTSLQSFVLQHPEWRQLVTWGGTSFHYSKILLVREYLLYVNNQNHSQSERSSLTVDDIDLDISWEEASTALFETDDSRLNANVSKSDAPTGYN